MTITDNVYYVHPLEQVGWIRLGKFDHRVHTGGFQQDGVFRINPIDPVQVDVVDPLQDLLAADTGFLRNLSATSGRVVSLDQALAVEDSNRLEFFGIDQA